jgi:hypothetical protein
MDLTEPIVAEFHSKWQRNEFAGMFRVDGNLARFFSGLHT